MVCIERERYEEFISKEVFFPVAVAVSSLQMVRLKWFDKGKVKNVSNSSCFFGLQGFIGPQKREKKERRELNHKMLP